MADAAEDDISESVAHHFAIRATLVEGELRGSSALLFWTAVQFNMAVHTCCL
jgi:hypothetical protein